MKKKAIILGAGAAGLMVARQLKTSEEAELYPVAFIDDDPNKKNLEMYGIPVIGGTEDIEQAVLDLKADYIILAIPSLTKERLNHITSLCLSTKAKTQILPNMEDLMMGKISITQFRDVEVEDLLGREPIDLEMDNIASYIHQETILVTGAGGSIGSEICRQIAPFSPKKMILLGHGENSIHAIELELVDRYGSQIQFITEIADIQDQYKILHIMEKHRPSVVFHAAAHKHVPLMERNPEEAVKNNIMGTKNVAEAASQSRVKTFVMISTDKAVKPSSVMGATKRIAEMVVQHMDTISATRFVAVRFGNVLGSRGSVIPVFKNQIKNGGPVKVTHPDMVRYFMTIPEASRLVLQAAALAQGGEVFVLDMGEPVKIIDLAKNLIRLSGYTLDEIKIEYTGIRPGEKMFEELLNEDEVHDEQVYTKIYRGKSRHPGQHIVEALLNEFGQMNERDLRNRLLDIANDQIPSEHLVVS